MEDDEVLAAAKSHPDHYQRRHADVDAHEGVHIVPREESIGEERRGRRPSR